MAPADVNSSFCEYRVENPNTNPWYVLMTLSGEQNDASSDRDGRQTYNEELHELNRRLWNAWAGQSMTIEAREKVGRLSKVYEEELAGRDFDLAEVRERHKSEMLNRNGTGFEYPGFPDRSGMIGLFDLEFNHMLCLERFYFPLPLVVRRSTFKKGIHSPGVMGARGTYFDEVEFEESAQFGSSWFDRFETKKSTFHGRVGFPGVEFKEAITFSEVKFLGAAIFLQTKFVTKQPEPDFHPIRVKFEKLKFHDSVIFNASYQPP